MDYNEWLMMGLDYYDQYTKEMEEYYDMLRDNCTHTPCDTGIPGGDIWCTKCDVNLKYNTETGTYSEGTK